MEIIVILFLVFRLDLWVIRFFLLIIMKIYYFWGELFNWGVLAEEIFFLSVLVMFGYCYEKNYY